MSQPIKLDGNCSNLISSRDKEILSVDIVEDNGFSQNGQISYPQSSHNHAEQLFEQGVCPVKATENSYERNNTDGVEGYLVEISRA